MGPFIKVHGYKYCASKDTLFSMKTLINPSVHRWANWSHYLHSEKNSMEGHRRVRRGRLARAHSDHETWFVWRRRKQSRQLTSLVDDFIASKAAAAHWNRTRTHSELRLSLKWCHCGEILSLGCCLWPALGCHTERTDKVSIFFCVFFFFSFLFWLFDEWLGFWENPGCVTLNMSSLIMTWGNT